jgi:hypothetical protein
MLWRKILAVGEMWLIGFFLVSPLSAGTIVQNFNNNSFNIKYFWLNNPPFPDPTKPLMVVSGNRLELTVPINPTNGAAGLENLSGYQLIGNFDIQFDFNLLSWPADNGVQAGIITPGNRGVSLSRVNTDFGQGAGEAYTVYFAAEQQPGHPDIVHVVPTSDSSGRLRLNRTGNTISAYSLQNNIWQLIGAHTDAQYSGTPIQFYVGGHVNDHSNSQITQVAFDNLQVTNVLFPSSLPPLGLLMDN